MNMERVAVCIEKTEPNDKAVVANLVQLYLYDMTGDLPFPIGRDGKFEYDFLDRFWQHPYLIFRGDELAGFALVINGSPVTDTPTATSWPSSLSSRLIVAKGLGQRRSSK
jgi:predicted acetyltransferase